MWFGFFWSGPHFANEVFDDFLVKYDYLLFFLYKGCFRTFLPQILSQVILFDLYSINDLVGKVRISSANCKNFFHLSNFKKFDFQQGFEIIERKTFK